MTVAGNKQKRPIGYAKLFCFLLLTFVTGCGQDFDDDGSQTLAGGCGGVLGSVDGVSAYSNGYHTGTGNSCAGTGGTHGYLYQCVELVNRYFMTKFQAPRVYCNAKDCLDSFGASSGAFEAYSNGRVPMPRKGDAITFSGGTYGHIALVSSVQGNQVTILNQNTASAYGTLTFAQGRLANWGSMTTQGLIRNRRNSDQGSDSVTVVVPDQQGTQASQQRCQSACTLEVFDPLFESPPNVNIRAEASTQSARLGAVAVGTSLCYLGKTEKNGKAHSYNTLSSSTYHQVQFQGQIGWIWAPYAKTSSCMTQQQ
jgi:surface antigen